MNHSYALGDVQLTIVSGGQMRLDGGNMFGVIPRVMWERVAPPDDKNRILLETNCLLVRTPDSLGLIDTGYGDKAPQKIRTRLAMEDGMPLLRNLATVGVSPDDVDWVVLTHLHFDHAGGATIRDEDGELRPTFPRARHYVQRAEWDDATGNLPELVGAYFIDDFLPLERAGQLEVIDGPVEITPGVSTRLTGGHTRGHQLVLLESGGESAVCPVDLCPTTAHCPVFWTMAYDQFPLAVRRMKAELLDDIVANNRLLMFAHDPNIAAAHLVEEADGRLHVVPVPRS